MRERKLTSKDAIYEREDRIPNEKNGGGWP